jgi:hypothetical protein
MWMGFMASVWAPDGLLLAPGPLRPYERAVASGVFGPP